MIKLDRSKENKWILQKNISSADLILKFVDIVNENELFDKYNIKKQLKTNDGYHGRNITGSSNTMGVRLSQSCFYMFGYMDNKKFLPTPMTKLLSKGYSKLSSAQIFLVNLYSMQYPSPYSKTKSTFKIYIGRLLVKLLLDKKLDEKLYIDECIYFLVFLEQINQKFYVELVESILEFRQLNYEEKKELFESVENYNDIFANSLHEMNYYFLRIFQELGVFKIIGDKLHNNGKLFSFKHGKDSKRNDAYYPRKKYSGYVIMNPNLKKDAIKLNNKFSAFDSPLTQAESLSKKGWIRELYQFKPLEYLETIIESKDKNNIIKIIKNMVHNSKYGTKDGKSFENSLKPIFEMFRETIEVEIISGAGDTDLLCLMDNEYNQFYKVNVDAKTSKNITSSINPIRITKHIEKNGSKYCIIVSPRFAKGVNDDISHFDIVTIEAETLANYCLNECLSSKDNRADYNSLDNLITNNLGTDITKKVNNLIEEKFEIV